jgi:hypothetical protein
MSHKTHRPGVPGWLKMVVCLTVASEGRCPFGDRPTDTPEHRRPGPRGLRERCLVRPVRSIVR